MILLLRQVKGAVVLLDAIGRHIRDLRKAKGLKQSDMAGLLNISQATYSKIERGDIRLRTSTLREISSVLAISPSELVRYDHQITQDDVVFGMETLAYIQSEILNGNHLEALRQIRQACNAEYFRRDPENMAELQILKLKALTSTGDISAADQTFIELEENKNLIKGRELMREYEVCTGRYFMGKGDYGQAILAFERAEKYRLPFGTPYPGEREIQYQYCLALYFAGYLEDAEEELKQSVAYLNKEIQTALQTKAKLFFESARVHRDNGNMLKAIAAYLESLEQYKLLQDLGRQMEIQAYLWELYTRIGLTAEASGWLDEFARLSHQYPNQVPSVAREILNTLEMNRLST